MSDFTLQHPAAVSIAGCRCCLHGVRSGAAIVSYVAGARKYLEFKRRQVKWNLSDPRRLWQSIDRLLHCGPFPPAERSYRGC